MAEPFKNLINAELVAHTGAHLKRVWPDFDQRRFVREAAADLDALEMKARATRSGTAGLAGWVVWSLGEFVVRRGLHEPERALQTLHALT